MSSNKDTANLGIGEEQLRTIGLCILGGVVVTVLLVVLVDWLYRRNAPVVRIELDVESAGVPQADSVHEGTSAGKVSSRKPGPSGIGDQEEREPHREELQQKQQWQQHKQQQNEGRAQMSSPDAYAFSKPGTSDARATSKPGAQDAVQPPQPVAATRGERHGGGHGAKDEEWTRHRHRHRSRSSLPIGDQEDGRERAPENDHPTRAPSLEKVPLAPSRPPAPGLHGSTPAKDEAERRHRSRRHRSDEAGAPPETSGLGDGNGERRHRSRHRSSSPQPAEHRHHREYDRERAGGDGGDGGGGEGDRRSREREVGGETLGARRHRSSRHLADAPNTAPIASVPSERTPVATRAHRHHHRDGYRGTTEAPPPRLRESHREGGHREAGRESRGRGNSRHPRTSSSSPDDRQHRSRHRGQQDGNHDHASPRRSHHHHETRQRI